MPAALQHPFLAEVGTLAAFVSPMTRPFLGLACVVAAACSQTAPPIDTPATLPPAEPPADVTRSADEPTVDKAANASKPEQQVDSKPVAKP